MATAPIDSEDRHGIGGNNPPMSIKEKALLDAMGPLRPLLDRAKELIATAETAKAENAEQAGKCADLIKMIRACDTEIDTKRKEVQQPYKDAVDVIMDIPRKAKLDLSLAKNRVEKIATEFDRAERKRIADLAAQEAEQKKADEESLATRAKAMGVELPPEEPKKEPVRAKPAKPFVSDLGTASYVKKDKTYTVSDPYALPMAVLTHEKVVAAIVSVVREMHRAAPDEKIKGIIIGETETTVFK